MARMTELRELLAEFGLSLRAYDPGVSASQKIGTKDLSLDFDGVEWAWLEPLLVELRDRRKIPFVV